MREPERSRSGFAGRRSHDRAAGRGEGVNVTEVTDESTLTDEQLFLQRSLADLEAEHDAGDIDEADYETLKRRYTSRYEAVERDLRAKTTTGLATEAAPPRRSLKVPVAIAVIVALAG